MLAFGIFALFGILNLESLTQKQSTCCHASSSPILKRTHTNEISESLFNNNPILLAKKAVSYSRNGEIYSGWHVNSTHTDATPRFELCVLNIPTPYTILKRTRTNEVSEYPSNYNPTLLTKNADSYSRFGETHDDGHKNSTDATPRFELKCANYPHPAYW